MSTASASRALKRPDSVSPELRARILAAASRLCYVPNLAARELATSQPICRIGVVLIRPDDSPCTRALVAMEARLAAAGHGLLMATVDSPDEIEKVVRRLALSGSDALVACGGPAQWLLGQGVWLPCIGMDFSPGVNTEHTFSIDWRQGVRTLAGCLMTLGHRNIAVATCVDHALWGDAVVTELRGLSTAIAATRWCERTDSLSKVMTERLIAPARPTAVLCMSEIEAVQLLMCCAGAGINVPQKLSIVVWGDGNLAKCMVPRLSAIRVPAANVGIRVAEALLRMLDGQTIVATAAPMKLVLRQSVVTAYSGQ